MSCFNISERLFRLLCFNNYLKNLHTILTTSQNPSLYQRRKQEEIFLLTPDVKIARFFSSNISSTSSLVLDFPAKLVYMTVNLNEFLYVFKSHYAVKLFTSFCSFYWQLALTNFQLSLNSLFTFFSIANLNCVIFTHHIHKIPRQCGMLKDLNSLGLVKWIQGVCRGVQGMGWATSTRCQGY